MTVACNTQLTNSGSVGKYQIEREEIICDFTNHSILSITLFTLENVSRLIATYC